MYVLVYNDYFGVFVRFSCVKTREMRLAPVEVKICETQVVFVEIILNPFIVYLVVHLMK